MAAIGRFQKGDDIFYAKVEDGALYKLKGDVFGAPSYQKKPIPKKGRTLVPVQPSKLFVLGLTTPITLPNPASKCRSLRFWLKSPNPSCPTGVKSTFLSPNTVWITRRNWPS